jgi:hypothetical protein
MSKVFKVKSSSHTNAVEDEEFKALNSDIDRGCFGVELVSPTLGGDVQADQPFSVEISKFYTVFVPSNILIINT